MAQKSCQVPSYAGDGSTLSPSPSFASVSESVKTKKTLERPFKKVKTHLSSDSKSSTINWDVASQNTTNNDEASTVSSDSSDIEIVEVDLEKELL